MADDRATPVEWPIEDGAIVLHGGNANYPTAETIPLAAITATRLTRSVKWPTDALICIGIGVVNIAVALIFNQTNAGPSAFVLGFILIAIGLFMRWRTEAIYRLVLVSGDTETIGAESTDKTRIDIASASLDQLRAASQ